jgi:D-beta-D-heptose 7-phosphate kinase/D-beta-D-heptose 1-phosphate adenosyltransferase
LLAILKRFPGQRLLVLGDVILDRYWWGEASRLSPEAPVPVVRLERSSLRPGGAGNTAANLVALGAAASLFGVAGEDAEASELKAVLREAGVNAEGLFTHAGRRTTTKTRIIAGHQQVVRVDAEHTAPIPGELALGAAAVIARELDGAQAIVISDYAKGFLSPALLEVVIASAVDAHKPVFADPKGADHTRYRGATLLKPNRAELALLTTMPVTNRAEAIAAGCRLSALLEGTRVLVTEGAEGMTLFADGARVEHVASKPREVFDVTGAGDTVLATLAMAVTAGATWLEAMQLATVAAAIAIEQMGAAVVTCAQLEAAL